MAEQVKNPVRWQEITEALAAAGAEAIIEFGPGKTLTGFTKKTAPDVTALNVSDAESLDAAVSFICIEKQESKKL
jgi:[acyl-carrier-protein] S-malonyltransferase